jgi:hypothetical protein
MCYYRELLLDLFESSDFFIHSGQTERKNPDGTHEVLFTNGCVKFYRQDGREDYIFPDNTVYQLDPNGDAVLFLPNGQKEIHSANWKKRIYPDGTTKTLYNDGTFETEYPNGRIRRRDPSGKLVSDNENQSISTAKTTNGIGNSPMCLVLSKQNTDSSFVRWNLNL